MASYIKWRGAAWHFRIGVPAALQPIIGTSEITHTLGTPAKAHAQATALQMAGMARALFNQLTAMTDDTKLTIILKEKKKELRFREKEDQHFDEMVAAAKQRIALASALAQVKIEKIHEQARANREAARADQALNALAQAPNRQLVQKPNAGLLLSELAEKWLAQRGQKAAAKSAGPGKDGAGRTTLNADHRAISLFLSTIGDMDVASLKRSHFRDYIDAVTLMPKIGGKPAVFEACSSVHDYIRVNNDLPAPFPPMRFTSIKTSHTAKLNAFVNWCIDNHEDKGFPASLAGVFKRYEYIGTNKGGDTGARAIDDHELRQLFEGEFMAEAASSADPEMQECYWLMHLGLFTGMRIGETLMINPQADIIMHEGIPLIQLTEGTEKAPNVYNSIKGNDKDQSKDRDIPVHSKLVELGFLDYVERCRKAGHKTLFPALVARSDNPSGYIGKRVSDWFDDAGIYDNEPKGKGSAKGVLTGFHCFRDTFITAARNAGVSNLPGHFHIVGHKNNNANGAEEKSYNGAFKASVLRDVMDAIRYPLTLAPMRCQSTNFYQPPKTIIKNNDLQDKEDKNTTIQTTFVK